MIKYAIVEVGDSYDPNYACLVGKEDQNATALVTCMDGSLQCTRKIMSKDRAALLRYVHPSWSELTDEDIARLRRTKGVSHALALKRLSRETYDAMCHGAFEDTVPHFHRVYAPFGHYSGGIRQNGVCTDIAFSKPKDVEWRGFAALIRRAMERTFEQLRAGMTCDECHESFLTEVSKEISIEKNVLRHFVPYRFVHHIGYVKEETYDDLQIGDTITVNASLRGGKYEDVILPNGFVQFKKPAYVVNEDRLVWLIRNTRE